MTANFRLDRTTGSAVDGEAFGSISPGFRPSFLIGGGVIVYSSGWKPAGVTLAADGTLSLNGGVAGVTSVMGSLVFTRA